MSQDRMRGAEIKVDRHGAHCSNCSAPLYADNIRFDQSRYGTVITLEIRDSLESFLGYNARSGSDHSGYLDEIIRFPVVAPTPPDPFEVWKEQEDRAEALDLQLVELASSRASLRSSP